MLRIYPVSLRMAADAATAVNRIGRKDPDLARQLRRAAASVPLNIAEGTAGLGKTRTARYADALGSAYEVDACLDVAVAMRYVPEPDAAVRERLRHIIGTLVKLTR